MTWAAKLGSGSQSALPAAFEPDRLGPSERVHRSRTFGKIALAIGGAGLLVCVAGAFFDRAELFESYLFAWWFFLGISLGSLSILMIHQLTGGAWGRVLEAPLRAVIAPLPLLAVLFLPLIVGHADLYIWARPADFGEPALLQAKNWYLNPTFFWARAIVYFAVWIVLGHVLGRLLDRRIDRVSDHSPGETRGDRAAGRATSEIAAERDVEGSGAGRTQRQLRTISIAGLIAYALTITFASIDWIMSLTPAWYSTGFGLLIMVGQTMAAFAFAIVHSVWMRHGAATATTRSKLPPGSSSGSLLSTPENFNDLGNLLLMLVMTWAYLAFTQYLITWAENLPHEIVWYLPRTQTSWKWIGIFLVVFHFAAPFVLLLFRLIKRNAGLLAALAGALLFAHWVDALWLVAPTFRGDGFRLYWTDIAATVGIGGIWLGIVLSALSEFDLRMPAEIETPADAEPPEVGRG